MRTLKEKYEEDNLKRLKNFVLMVRRKALKKPFFLRGEYLIELKVFNDLCKISEMELVLDSGDRIQWKKSSLFRNDYFTARSEVMEDGSDYVRFYILDEWYYDFD